MTKTLALVLLVLGVALPASAQTQGQQSGYLRALNDCVVLQSAGMGTGAVTLVGTWSGTVTFYVGTTGDAADYSTTNMRPPNGSSDITSTSANGSWSGSIAGYRFFRVCMTTYNSGTAGVLLSSAATGGGGGTGGSSGVVTQGSPTSGQSGMLAQASVLTSAPTYTNGQTSALVLDTGGSLLVKVTNAASGGSSLADNATFTDNSTSLNPIGGVAESASPTSCAEGKECTVRTTLARGMNVVLADSAGNYLALSADPTHDAAVSATGPQIQLEAKDFDGSALPNVVSGEGDAVRAAGSLYGIQYVMPLSENGSEIAGISIGAVASSTNSATECVIVSAASTNSTNCKNAGGNLFGYDLLNTTTTTYYLRFYNSSSAPTCSSATGFIRSIPIPPAGASGQVGGVVRQLPLPVAYATGISYCLTGGSSSTDNTNAATGIFGALLYK